MENQFIKIESISQVHETLGLPKPLHPLISLIDAKHFRIPEEMVGVKMINQLYMVSLKDKSCGTEYGRHTFDFKKGVMVFSKPNQVSSNNNTVQQGDINGWMLLFHPDLIRGTNLGAQI